MVAQLRGCEFELKMPSVSRYEPSNRDVARAALNDVAEWLGYQFANMFMRAQESDSAEVRRRLDETL